MPSFYPDVQNNVYKNTFYLMNIYLEEYIAKQFLLGQTDRIIYSSTEYALIKRSQKEQWNNANLPFINYKGYGKVFGGARPWYNFQAATQGIFVPELGRKLKMIPIAISYDMTYWTSRDDDLQYVTDKIILDESLDTRFPYYVQYGSETMKNIASMVYEEDTSIRFTEKDWLEQNNIHAVGLNPTIQTWMMFDNVEGFCIPKTLLINYLVKKDLIPASDGDVIEYQEAMRLVIDHQTETIHS